MADAAKKGTGLAAFAKRNGAGKPSDPPTPAHPRKEKRRLTDGREQLLVYLQPEGIKRLKLESLERERSVSELVQEAVNTWFQTHGLPPIA